MTPRARTASGLLLMATLLEGARDARAQGLVPTPSPSPAPVAAAPGNTLAPVPAANSIPVPATTSGGIPVRPIATTPQPVSGAPALSPIPTTTAAPAAPMTAAPAVPSPISAASPARGPAPVTTPVAAAPIAPVAVAPVAVAVPCPPQFVPLYNGQDLTGWEIHDGKLESWKAEGELLSCIAPGGGWLRSKTQYTDFVMRFEYRLTAGANTGVAFRFPSEGNPASNGFEVQLLDDTAPKYQGIAAAQHTGALYYFVPPQAPAPVAAIGAWNRCQVSVRGPRIDVQINDVLVNTVLLDDPALNTGTKPGRKPIEQHPPLGHVGLQSYSTRVDFRKIELLDLTQATAGGVRFVDVVAGSGEPLPGDATVTAHFRGQFVDGRNFIQTKDRGQPVTVALKDVIVGWREGLVGMQSGGRRRLIVPPQMAYGEKGYGALVPPNATLVYDVELISFQRLSPAPAPATGTAAAPMGTPR